MRLSGLRSAIGAHWRSPFALGFALAHAVLFCVIIFSEPPLPPPSDEPCPPDLACLSYWDSGSGVIIASRFFHTELGFTLLSWADFPALILEVVFLGLPAYLAGIEFARVTGSYIEAWSWLLFGTLQWWLCGILVAHARARAARRATWP